MKGKGDTTQQREEEALRHLAATAHYHASRLPASSPYRDVCQEAHSVFADCLGEDAHSVVDDLLAEAVVADRPAPVETGRPYLRVIEGGGSHRPAPVAPPVTFEAEQASRPMQAAALVQAEARRRPWLTTQVALGILAAIPFPHPYQRADLWHAVLHTIPGLIS